MRGGLEMGKEKIQSWIVNKLKLNHFLIYINGNGPD